jgi:hypothetical protein
MSYEACLFESVFMGTLTPCHMTYMYPPPHMKTLSCLFESVFMRTLTPCAFGTENAI